MTHYKILVPSENMTALLCELSRSKVAFEKASKSPMFKPVKLAFAKAFGGTSDMPVMFIEYKQIDRITIALEMSFVSESMVRPDIMLNNLTKMLQQYDATIEKVEEKNAK